MELLKDHKECFERTARQWHQLKLLKRMQLLPWPRFVGWPGLGPGPRNGSIADGRFEGEAAERAWAPLYAHMTPRYPLTSDLTYRSNNIYYCRLNREPGASKRCLIKVCLRSLILLPNPSPFSVGQAMMCSASW